MLLHYQGLYELFVSKFVKSEGRGIITYYTVYLEQIVDILIIVSEITTTQVGPRTKVCRSFVQCGSGSRMRDPKRTSNITKLFNLSKEDDVRKYVNMYCRTFTNKKGKEVNKAPKIQRKRARIAEKKQRIAKAKRGSGIPEIA
ncbi:unnamed protein product [Cuscuta epithymum]|uniref:Uncharacterized protein n=1 Tax=Cuscuta epithymum TaxID=186058 RepID=A0AAV0FV44_9ASTE|nr:unnamed protein product [Cuscuta epithymum]